VGSRKRERGPTARSCRSWSANGGAGSEMTCFGPRLLSSKRRRTDLGSSRTAPSRHTTSRSSSRTSRSPSMTSRSPHASSRKQPRPSRFFDVTVSAPQRSSSTPLLSCCASSLTSPKPYRTCPKSSRAWRGSRTDAARSWRRSRSRSVTSAKPERHDFERERRWDDSSRSSRDSSRA
jgi:hypothetical protein